MEVEEKEKFKGASPVHVDFNMNNFGNHDLQKSLPLNWTKDMWTLVDPDLIIPNNEVCITSDTILEEIEEKDKVKCCTNEITDRHEYHFGSLNMSDKNRSIMKILTKNKGRNAEVKTCTVVEQDTNEKENIDGNKVAYLEVKMSYRGDSKSKALKRKAPFCSEDPKKLKLSLLDGDNQSRISMKDIVKNYNKSSHLKLENKSYNFRRSSLKVGGNKGSSSVIRAKDHAFFRNADFCSDDRGEDEGVPPLLVSHVQDSRNALIDKRKMMSFEDSDIEVYEEEYDQKVLLALRSFKHVSENHYLCKRNVNKHSKKLRCDCSISLNDMKASEMGCLSDCLNRLLYIECGKICSLKQFCSNRMFQNQDYADIEVFETEWKGFGVRARQEIPKGTFIMEYIGEVINRKQFIKRADKYAKRQVKHFYFMELSKEKYIDAATMGNISRFLNHSCDPNCETQKWTVNGELRVGFFSKQDIKEGEELNFDYRFERYGSSAQRCFCGTDKCRGWLGAEPTSAKNSTLRSNFDELNNSAVINSKMKGDIPLRVEEDLLDIDEFDDEYERLLASGVKNKNQLLLLCRLMWRTYKSEMRIKLITLLNEADPVYLSLFLDYQGLRIIGSWFISLNDKELNLKLKIQAILAKLKIPNKNMLLDSKIFQTMQSWSGGASVEKQEETVAQDNRVLHNCLNNVECSSSQNLNNELQKNARTLIESWASLKENYRIPKRRRQAVRKEHEREANNNLNGWDGVKFENTPEARLAMLQANTRVFACMQNTSGNSNEVKQVAEVEEEEIRFLCQESIKKDARGNRKDKECNTSQLSKDRWNLRLDDKSGKLSSSSLTRDERRILFKAKVEEETRQKHLRASLASRHFQCCSLLGLDPLVTMMMDSYPKFYLSAGEWVPMPPPPLHIDNSWVAPKMADFPPLSYPRNKTRVRNVCSLYPPVISSEIFPPQYETVPHHYYEMVPSTQCFVSKLPLLPNPFPQYYSPTYTRQYYEGYPSSFIQYPVRTSIFKNHNVMHPFTNSHSVQNSTLHQSGAQNYNSDNSTSDQCLSHSYSPDYAIDSSTSTLSSLSRSKTEDDGNREIFNQCETPTQEINSSGKAVNDYIPRNKEEFLMTCGESVVTAVADTSSDLKKKLNDEFLQDLSKLVVMLLNPYRKERIQGYIVCHDDFKHLARKLTHNIMFKELKFFGAPERAKVDSRVKKRAAEYIRRYMLKFKKDYRRSPPI